METNPRNFVAYYRISKDSHKAGRSKANGLGLESQKQIISHYYGDAVVKEFTETKSAKNITDRPVLKEAIDYCLKHGLWLCTAKLDRLSRNVDDVRSIVKALDGNVSFCDIPSEGKADIFTITIYSAFAERERELISIRTSQALQVKIKRSGSWQKRIKAFCNGTIAKKGREAIQEKVANNENILRAAEVIMDKKAQGLSYPVIADLLNKAKFVTPRGFSFSAVQVYRIYERYSLNA